MAARKIAAAAGILVFGAAVYAATYFGFSAKAMDRAPAPHAPHASPQAQGTVDLEPGGAPILLAPMRYNMVGCKSLAEMQSIAGMIQSNHRQNAQVLMSQDVNRSTCQWFFAGETVSVEALHDVFAKVDRPGEADGYWMVSGALQLPALAHGTSPK